MNQEFQTNLERSFDSEDDFDKTDFEYDFDKIDIEEVDYTAIQKTSNYLKTLEELDVDDYGESEDREMEIWTRIFLSGTTPYAFWGMSKNLGQFDFLGHDAEDFTSGGALLLSSVVSPLFDRRGGGGGGNRRRRRIGFGARQAFNQRKGIWERYFYWIRREIGELELNHRLSQSLREYYIKKLRKKIWNVLAAIAKPKDMEPWVDMNNYIKEKDKSPHLPARVQSDGIAGPGFEGIVQAWIASGMHTPEVPFY